jgi:hypothetical protein
VTGWPWVYADRDGDELTIDEAGGQAHVCTDEDGAVVTRDGLPLVAAKLYEAAGMGAPVILDRPGDPAAEIWFFAAGADLRFFAEDGRIEVRNKTGGGVSGQAFPVAVIRDLAARLAVLCDEAEDEPDPAEVDDLAAVLMEPGVMGLDGARPLARRILAAGYTREAGS